jgi:hypothetical protein
MIKILILLCILVIASTGDDNKKNILKCNFEYELCVEYCVSGDRCYYEMEVCSDKCIETKKKCKAKENK